MTVVRHRLLAWRECLVAAFLGSSCVITSALADSPKAKNSTSKSGMTSSSAFKTTGARLDFVDRVIRESWASANIKASRVASDEEFMRRAYLDVLGRIPNLAEAKAFLASKEQGKRAKLVEYLLAHPDYEEELRESVEDHPDRPIQSRGRISTRRPFRDLAPAAVRRQSTLE